MKKDELNPKPITHSTKEDEVDVNQLFEMIGKGFSNIFSFIGNIIYTFFYWILLQILFIRNNFKRLILAATIGGLLGGVYQYGIKEIKYESSMTVEPNFGSAFQLYKNIDFYLSLIEQNDYERLAESLNISSEEARSISRIEVEPYSNESQSLLSFKDFIGGLDSLTINLIDYKTYVKKQPVESYKYHLIKVTSKDKYIFDKLEYPIINSITKNTYYDKVKSTSYSNLMSRKHALLASISELDSLRSIYKKVLLAESVKENSGTNIFLSQVEIDNKQLFLFDKYMLMNQQLIEANKKLMEEDKLINVVSSFNSIGMKVNDWFLNFAVIGFIAGFLLLYLYLIFKELNQILSQYEKSKMQLNKEH
jgi:hypothetical protein